MSPTGRHRSGHHRSGRHTNRLASSLSGRTAGAVFATLLASSGCELEEELPTPIPIGSDAGTSPYADLVVSFSENGIPVACDNSIGAVCGPSAGSCADHPSLGAPDSVVFELTGQNSLELALLCHPIIDRSDNGGLGNDFKVWATINSGRAIVSVSEDGSTYTILQELRLSDQSFDLAEQDIQFARFVQITGATSNTSISIDAVEAL